MNDKASGICEHPDSGKVSAYSSGSVLIQRRENSLDDWDVEA